MKEVNETCVVVPACKTEMTEHRTTREIDGTCDVTSLFLQLPDDVQRIVARYVPLWQRRGLRKPIAVYQGVPTNEWASPHGHYYRRIRQCPRGAWWSAYWPTHLHVRRQAHVFQWELRVSSLSYTEDEWVLMMTPQWPDDVRTTEAVLPRLWDAFHRQLWMPHLGGIQAVASLQQVWLNEQERRLCFALLVERPSMTAPPTRQSCAEQMVALVRRLDDAMHREWVAARKKRRSCV